MATSPEDLTGLLLDWQAGDGDALERLTPLVYQGFKRLAGKRLQGERPGHTLQPTALVHEAYLRLVDQERVEWQSRAQFFALAARIMRRILVDHARKRSADKRHGQAVAISLDDAPDAALPHDLDLVRLDDALGDLAKLDPRQSRIIELRYFGGLTIDETAAALEISPATVKVDWKMAKAWLFDQLRG